MEHTVYARAFALALLLSACHHSTYTHPGMSTSGFRFSPGSAIVGDASDTLRVAVVVVNGSREQREIAIPTCAPFLNQVQAKLRRNGRVWSSETYEKRKMPTYFDSVGRPIPQVCPAVLLVMTFPPGASHTYVVRVPVRDILGDSLPSGRYSVMASLRINGDLKKALDAGHVELAHKPI